MTNEDDKELRSNYRELAAKAKRRKHELGASNGGQLKEILEQANELHAQVNKPREQAIDSEIFAIVTDAGVDYLKRMGTGGQNFTAGDLIRRLKAHYGYDAIATQSDESDVLNWSHLGEYVSPFFASVPITSHMLGPLDALPKRKKVMAQRQKRREPVGEAVRPEEIANLHESEKQETDKNMEEMWEALKKAPGGKIPFMELVLNHDKESGFAQTNENIFTLAFLVRDQRVAYRDAEDGKGIIVVKRDIREDKKNKNKTELEREQLTVKVDFDVWEQWKTMVRPSDCVMKHRVFRDYGDEAGPSKKRARVSRAAEEEEDDE